MPWPWTAEASEYARRLAVQRVGDGDTVGEAAELVGASVRSVRRWLKAFRRSGEQGLVRGRSTGAPPKLTPQQESQILGWLDARPGDFGFPTERWTAVRIGVLIEQFFQVRMNPRYLNDWLARRGITPQLPQRKPRERNDAAVEAWVRYTWPRIKKKSAIAVEP